MALLLRTVLTLQPGSDADFDRVGRAWVERTRGEPGTLDFDLYLDRANRRAVFLERYSDAAAFLAHAAGVDPELRAELYRTCRFAGLEVFGEVTDQVRELLAPAGACFYTPVAGR